MFSAIYSYLSLLFSHLMSHFSHFSYFHLLFPSLLATRLIFKIFNFYYNQPVTLGRQETLHSLLPNKKVRVNYNQTNALTFSWNKEFLVFSSSLSNYFLFSFWSDSCSHIKFYRSSHQRRSMKKGVLRNFAKFTGKHLCQGLFFN